MYSACSAVQCVRNTPRWKLIIRRMMSSIFRTTRITGSIDEDLLVRCFSQLLSCRIRKCVFACDSVCVFFCVCVSVCLWKCVCVPELAPGSLSMPESPEGCNKERLVPKTMMHAHAHAHAHTHWAEPGVCPDLGWTQTMRVLTTDYYVKVYITFLRWHIYAWETLLLCVCVCVCVCCSRMTALPWHFLRGKLHSSLLSSS